jgi:hypothetical protein
LLSLPRTLIDGGLSSIGAHPHSRSVVAASDCGFTRISDFVARTFR